MSELKSISQIAAAALIDGSEIALFSKLSSTVTITATTISAQASDNSYNDSGSGFVTAGFAVGDRVWVDGYTGTAANNLFSGVVTALAADKITIGGTDGDVIVDEAAGNTITITKWESVRLTSSQLASFRPGVPKVRAATTAAGTLATDFENGDTLDGVVLATGDRILVKDQASGAENGIYTVAAAGAPVRAEDASESDQLVNYACFVSEGTTNADKLFQCTTNAPITVDTTVLTFVEFTSGSGGGSGGAAPAFRGAKVRKASSLTAQNLTTSTAITWDTEDYDTDSIHSTVSNTSRLTVPAGVTKVRLKGQLRLTNATADEYAIAGIRKNGSASYNGYATQVQDATLGAVLINVAGPVLVVTAGDYFELYAQVQTDTSVDIDSSSWFSMEIVEGPAVDVAVAGSIIGGALVKKSADQTGANFTGTTALTWDTDVYDTHNAHDTSTNTNRITVPAGVTKARFSASIAFNNLTADMFSAVVIRKAGSGSFNGGAGSWTEIGNTLPRHSVSTPIIEVAAGDWFEVAVLVESDTSVDVTAAQSWFSAEWIEFAQQQEGTAFPSSPVDGQRFYRTDRNIEYFYDSANAQWLSTQLFSQAMSISDAVMPVSATTASRTPLPFGGDYSLWIEKFTVAMFNSATTSTNYMTARLNARGGATNTALGSGLSGQGDTGNVWVKHAEDINTALNGATYAALDASFTETGAFTGYCFATFTFRLVG